MNAIGNPAYPGGAAYYIRLGINLYGSGTGNGSGNGGSGSGNGSGGGSGALIPTGYGIASGRTLTSEFPSLSSGSTVTIGGMSGGGGGGSSSSDSSNSSGGAGTTSNFGGYGANISSGYSFALSSLNNYGTSTTTTLGSVPVHSYGGGGDLADTPEGQNGSGNSPMPDPNQGIEGIPSPIPSIGTQGPGSNLLKNLLGKNPGQIGAHPSMPVPAPVQGNP
jgi:hypothetical protein